MSEPRKPQDHKKPAAQAEAEGGPTDVVWRDHTFTVESDPDDWPVTVTLAFEEGKAMTGVRDLLGSEQWAELLRDKPTNRDIGDLFDTMAAVLGLDTSGN